MSADLKDFIARTSAHVHFLERNLDMAKGHAEKTIKILYNHKHAYLYQSFETLAEICFAKPLEAQNQGSGKL
jgi:hypothetical protein